MAPNFLFFFLREESSQQCFPSKLPKYHYSILSLDKIDWLLFLLTTNNFLCTKITLPWICFHAHLKQISLVFQYKNKWIILQVDSLLDMRCYDIAGWWYGIVGHLESCDGNESYCRCHNSGELMWGFFFFPASRTFCSSNFQKHEK